jgi:DNA-directed RNA polymerase subunit M/transcription elongation factor TFIIS
MTKVSENLGDIIFYCKDCEEIVETLRVGGKYVYKCKKCGTKNVAFGTRKSIYGFFRLEDEEEEVKDEEKEKVAAATAKDGAEEVAADDVVAAGETKK